MVVIKCRGQKFVFRNAQSGGCFNPILLSLIIALSKVGSSYSTAKIRRKEKSPLEILTKTWVVVIMCRALYYGSSLYNLEVQNYPPDFLNDPTDYPRKLPPLPSPPRLAYVRTFGSARIDGELDRKSSSIKLRDSFFKDSILKLLSAQTYLLRA